MPPIPPEIFLCSGTKTPLQGTELLINGCCWINKWPYLHLPLVCVMGIYWRPSLVCTKVGRREGAGLLEGPDNHIVGRERARRIPKTRQEAKKRVQSQRLIISNRSAAGNMMMLHFDSRRADRSLSGAECRFAAIFISGKTK